VTLSDVLAGVRSSRSLEAIDRRYHLAPGQAARCADLIRPVVLRQVDECLRSTNGSSNLLRALASPAVSAIEADTAAVSDQAVRLAGEAIHRQIIRHDADGWGAMDLIAREAGLSHQTLRALVPLLTLLVLGAIRSAAAPAFRRLLMQQQPDDAGTDPFLFAAQHADRLRGRAIKPQTALRWLDIVLARAQDERTELVAAPNDRIR